MKGKQFLSPVILQKLCETIRSSPVFEHSEQYCQQYNTLMASLHRLNTVLDFFNSRIDIPQSDIDVIIYIVFVAMLRDCVKTLQIDVFGKTDQRITTFFQNAVKTLSEEEHFFESFEQYNDEDVFEYLRSMVFAHPLNTSDRKRFFMEKGEKHRCPCTLSPGKMWMTDSVGIRVYTSKQEEWYDLRIPFLNLQKYVRYWYAQLTEITQCAQNVILQQEKIWLASPVVCDDDPIKTIKNLQSACNERWVDDSEISKLLNFLTFQFSQGNDFIISCFRQKIADTIPAICDAFNKLNYERVNELCFALLQCRPADLHEHAFYELEKIYGYLKKRSDVIAAESNEAWGLIQAQLFYESYAKRYVYIDLQTMTYQEIKMLVTISLFAGSDPSYKTNIQ